MFRTLVVTLSSGEAEELESRQSVSSQIDCDLTHNTISNFSEQEAHNQLLTLFRDNVDNFDLYVKVDADTIITHANAFKIVHNVISETGAAAAQLGLNDYFSCTQILGLNFYHPKRNLFNPTSDPLFCDRSIVHLAKHLYVNDFKTYNINPVGLHCAYPHDRQAFHYGYHRGLKNRPQLEIEVKTAAIKHKDRARILAVLGFEAARQHKKSHDYLHPDFESLFQNALLQFEDFSKKL